MSRFKRLRERFKKFGDYGDGPKVYCKHCNLHEWTTMIVRLGTIKLRCKKCRRWK